METSVTNVCLHIFLLCLGLAGINIMSQESEPLNGSGQWTDSGTRHTNVEW